MLVYLDLQQDSAGAPAGTPDGTPRAPTARLGLVGGGDLAGLIPFSHVWRFEASGKDLGTAWKEVDFDDSSWSAGPGPLGFETSPDQLPRSLGTRVPIHRDITYYFRTVFEFAGDPAGFDLVFTNLIDDGAVCYLNGVEIWRMGMPAGPVVFGTAANRTADNAAFEEMASPGFNLLPGTNVLAVEVHQVNKGSSDVVMGTSFFAVRVPPSRLSITNQPESITARETASAELSLGLLGRGAHFQWFMNNAVVPGANQSRLFIPSVQLSDAGDYFLVASNALNAVTSRVATLNVVPGKPPTITRALTNQVTKVGESAWFRAEVSGDKPLFFQWFRQGIPLEGSTNQVLSISRPFARAAGEYSFAVTNVFGSMVSRPATLEVQPHPLGQPGSLDRNFNAAPSQPVRSVAVQKDGRILIGGSFDAVNDIPQRLIARVHPDGSLDTEFRPVILGPAGSLIHVVKLGEDGKLLAGGLFSYVNGIARDGLALLNPDGSLDLTFAPAPDSPGCVRDIALQPDGKILAVGRSGAGNAPIIRLNQDGRRDPAFAPGLAGGDDCMSVAIQSDGRILVAGLFRRARTAEPQYVVRLGPDGSRDREFLVGGRGPDSIVQCIAVAGDKIILGGRFTSINGAACHRLARLNADGTPDSSFAPPIISGGAFGIDSVLVQPDGRLLVTGDFAQVGDVPRNGVARLLSDGRLDASFEIGRGASAGYERVRRVALTPTGDILIAGFFTAFDGFAQPYFARLVGRAGGP